MDLRPIPAFYCCYLLRSIRHHAKLYVGSTPNPLRRLAQHNGQIKGGAAQTARKSWQPWEMTCIVSGFPSQIAALQFEWAWQNPDLTRHITKAAPITNDPDVDAKSPNTGRTAKHPARPRLALKGGLDNLHLLLRVPYFNTWPLSLRFFLEDVYREWQGRSEKLHAAIPSRVKVRTDFGCSDEACKESRQAGQTPILIPSLSGRLKRLETSYNHMKPHLEKSRFLLDEEEEISCSICKNLLHLATDSIIVCSHGDCRSISHMTCLAGIFLEQGNDSSRMIPTQGSCPECHTRLQWADLVKEMTLRMYGEKEIKKVFRKRRVGVPQIDDDGEDDLDDADGLTAANVAGEDIDPEDMDDAASVTSTESDMSKVRAAPTFRVPAPLPMLIEESDWENAEVIDCSQR